MRLLSLVAGLVLICQAGVAAEPMELLVRTYPPGATMRDQFGNQLGLTGEPIVVEWSRESGPLSLELSMPGHAKVNRTLAYREIKAGVYPEDSEIRLPADSLGVTLLDFVRYRTGLLLFGLAVVGGLVGVARKRAGRQRGVVPELATVGRYRLLEKIGDGATAEVFRAVSVEDSGELPVALKLMKSSEALDGQSEARFRREIQTAISLEHPNLARVYDWGEDKDGRLYLVSELLEGETLRERLREEPRPSWNFVISLVGAVGEALHHLHDRELVHRDVKPENVFLTRAGEIKLVDLGLASGRDLAPMTEVGTAMGTPHYMAPEQIRGQAQPSSDQYSLGVLVFEMLAGQRPYRGQTGHEVLQQHLGAPVPDLAELRPDLEPLLRDTVRKSMGKRPEDRFPDIRTFASTVSRVLSPHQEMETGAYTELHE